MFKYSSTLFLFNLLAITGLAIASLPVLSQTTKLETQPNSTTEDRPVNLPNKVKLTPDQKKKVKVKINTMFQQIIAELTPEQRKKLGDSAQAKSEVIPLLKSLNLTADQTKKIKVVIRTTNDEIKTLLTPEQLNDLKLAQAQKSKK